MFDEYNQDRIKRVRLRCGEGIYNAEKVLIPAISLNAISRCRREIRLKHNQVYLIFRLPASVTDIVD